MPHGADHTPKTPGILLDANFQFELLKEQEARIAALEKENAELRLALKALGECWAVLARDVIKLSSAQSPAIAWPPPQPPACGD